MKTLNDGKFVGTPKQLAGRIALTINGQSTVLQQPDISFLTRMGMATAVGTEKKKTEGRGGKPSTIWEFDAKKISFQIEQLARKQSPGKRAPKATAPEANEASTTARKSADRKVAANANGEAPKRRGRPAKVENTGNSGLAAQIASAIVHVLDSQKAA
jgi:hypothetical protein